jgi:hypothetical protein
MAESHPFANSGLGSYGAGDSFAKAAMHPAAPKQGEMSLLGGALAAIMKSFGGDKKPAVDGSAPPPQQYEPSSAFPEVTQQQYVSPYQSGGGPNQIWGNNPSQNPMYGVMPPSSPNMPMAGFQTTSPFTTQPQTNPSGYHSAVDALWR